MSAMETPLPGELHPLWRLPEFDTVAVIVHGPTEPTILGRFLLLIDFNSGGAELIEHLVEILDTVIDHASAGLWAEVVGVPVKDRPSRRSRRTARPYFLAARNLAKTPKRASSCRWA